MNWLLACIALGVCGAALAQARSGLEFSSDEIRALQSSDAENPGMLWVDRGRSLWERHCTSCHGAAAMTGVAARYPRLAGGQIITLEEKIRQKLPGLVYESDELLALSAFVANQSRGLPLQPLAEENDVGKGRSAYYQRRGQVNLACAHCHEANAGKRLGPERLSQGQANGYPAYRLEWQTLGSLQRRLRACLFGVRAELPPYGSQELLELELYLAWRGRGLPVETPAVRR
jgi:L-cysteine S-thiosulfotransferase